MSGRHGDILRAEQPVPTKEVGFDGSSPNIFNVTAVYETSSYAPLTVSQAKAV